MIELNVPNMTCGGCARAVSNFVRQADPQAQIDVDLQTKIVHIDSAQPREALQKALADGGYPAD